MDIQPFLDYLTLERNASPLTVSTYLRELTAFESYFHNKDENLSWTTVESDIIRDYLSDSMDAGHKATYVCKQLSAIRSFYRFALRRGMITHDPAHLIRGPKKNRPLPQFMRESEMTRLIDGMENHKENYKEVRARTIILIFYETGIRLSELLSLNNNDIDFVRQEMKVTGKRRKQRVIPFGDELSQAMLQYMELRDQQQAKRNSDAFILNDRGNRTSRQTVYNIVREELSKVTTMKKRSPHVLRHTFATTMLNHGAGIESVKRLLGHKSLNTTQIYTHTSFDQLKKVYSQAHPRG